LLHPTALPGDQGVLGDAARRFIDWLARAGFTVWQVLPLGPVGAGRSPYWVRSDCALNPALIDHREAPDVTRDGDGFDAFCSANRGWLEDYALFEALSRRYQDLAWWDWPAPLRDRESQAMSAARAACADELHRCRVEQWQAATQWQSVRRYAQLRGVRLFGDLPIYVAPHSASVWSQREQFQLLGNGRPAAVAGVPPDYFAVDGQLWGNPLYDWEQARRDGFAYWRARLACQLRRFDLLRIDHFRGLAGYWSVPAGADTARQGAWFPAPGAELLSALRATVSDLPLVAEDLGVITPDVVALRREFALPGMRVLQFGFDGSPDNPHLPHNYQCETVAYTGTHDNDTTLGWYRSLPKDAARDVDDYLGSDAQQMPQAMVRAVIASVAQLAVVPMQDLLSLGSEARFNTPGTVGDNWQWRLPERALHRLPVEPLRAMNRRYGRLPDSRE